MEVPGEEEDARMITREELEFTREEVFKATNKTNNKQAMIGQILTGIWVELQYMNDRQELYPEGQEQDYKDSKAGFKPVDAARNRT